MKNSNFWFRKITAPRSIAWEYGRAGRKRWHWGEFSMALSVFARPKGRASAAFMLRNIRRRVREEVEASHAVAEGVGGALEADSRGPYSLGNR